MALIPWLLERFGPSRSERALGLLGRQGWEQSGPLQPGVSRETVGGSGLLGSQMTPEDIFRFQAGLADIYTPQETGGLMSALFPQEEEQKPTSLMQNVAAMGLQPGTPEYQQAVRDAVLKPQVAINQFPAPPTGYRYKDQNDPMAGLEAVPGGPATKPTEQEAKNISQGEMAEKMLAEIDAAYQSGVNVADPTLWARTEMAQLPVLSWFTKLTPDEAKITSNLEQFTNLYMAMLRGAQVGPAEQQLFAKQLPKVGQEDTLFRENLENSKRNLSYMMQRIQQLRTGGVQPPTQPAPPTAPPPPSTPAPPPGFILD